MTDSIAYGGLYYKRRKGYVYQHPGGAAPAEPPPPDVFDPATLTLTGWWRASFTNAPWVGTASEGTSGSNDLTAGNAPTAGSEVNSLTPADFDGSADHLIADGVLTDYFTTTAYGGGVLVWVDSISTNDANAFSNESILSNITSQRFAITLKSDNTVHVTHYDATNTVDASHAISTGAWQFVHWEFSGTQVRIGVNGDWGSYDTATTMQDGGQGLRVGRSVSDHYFDGKLLEIMTRKSVWDAGEVDDVIAYCNYRYGLSI